MVQAYKQHRHRQVTTRGAVFVHDKQLESDSKAAATDRQTDRQAGRQTGRQAGQQIHTYTVDFKSRLHKQGYELHAQVDTRLCSASLHVRQADRALN